MNSSTQMAEAPAAPVEATESPGPRPRRRGTLVSIQSILATLVIAIFVITFAVQAFQIPSESMENTLLIGDYLLVDKVHFAHGGLWGNFEPHRPIQRGDIIVFRYPVNPSQHFVKRVIGLPGDRVRLVNKQVFLNGKPLRESYVTYRDPARDHYRDDFPTTDFLNGNVDSHWWLQMKRYMSHREIVVPPGRYFVLGDNRDQSLDSRYWGFVPRENIVGRPLVIYWSLRRPEAEAMAIGSRDFGDKLIHFTDNLFHLWNETRWDRTLRLIK